LEIQQSTQIPQSLYPTQILKWELNLGLQSGRLAQNYPSYFLQTTA